MGGGYEQNGNRDTWVGKEGAGMDDETFLIDPLLEDLMNIGLSVSSGIPLTFFVGEFLVSGTAVAEEGYAAGIRVVFPHNKPNSRRPISCGESRFLHLRDVTIVVSGGNQIHTPHFRVRMSDAKGWAFGRL